ncbi:MAG TPA: hypothetical protein VMV49_01355 [Candidatus Deferrimicrobium sp.]|nr:hypothetical protein [Candidatus Deferrimicrobium sp.]
MNCKKVGLGAFILLALFFGTMVTNGVGFTQTPTYIDTGGDSLPPCTDILKIWVDNDATFLQFKLELNGSFDQYVWPVYEVYISIDNSTGSDLGWDLPIDCRIDFEINPIGVVYSFFEDFNNDTNNLEDPISAELMYYQLSNNNHTLELGYKLQTSDQGRGFLNVSIGQTIYLKLQGDWDSDLVPNLNVLIRYVLTEESGGIPSFGLPFLSLAVLAAVMFFLIAKKKATI